MGTKLPSTAASGDYSDDYDAIQKWHQEKEAWRANRAMENNETVDVLRYTSAGGDPVAGLKPTYTPVSGLTGQDVFADKKLKRYEAKFGAKIEEADVMFVLYDVTGAITMQDLIEYDGDEYRAMEVDFDSRSGRTEVLAMLNRSDT